MQDNPPLRGTRAVFTGAVLLSATLLFMLQPMYARMALPRLGGSPIVWSIATIVYQSVLLAGYAVAGEVATRMRPAAFAALHLVLMFAVFAVALPMQPPQPKLWRPSPLSWRPRRLPLPPPLPLQPSGTRSRLPL